MTIKFALRGYEYSESPPVSGFDNRRVGHPFSKEELRETD
jgi:hypothetical protein